ncbi:MAG: DNA-directed RNA polymerase subunit P [Candidatus Nanoarchaeia archaeon]
MVSYKCLTCDKVVSDTMMGRRVRCPYCGSKMLFKQRVLTKTIKAV